ncbi:flagellar basal body-associated FliL family protein [Mesorhizobium sp. LHD-90]|uniref:flagellar basal body-associated FliL family protein n=1 Tax=Mesorhizobium sp. LHD-90 TaxID=3071414 RepID=UPI0027E07707|nr:flagellar basal body-associated FliL family protein [Mesorhizobium sp. LHD-90]MDQ6433731.1 flagellar basal body-associated FliL family protein [Mesorhizobium sp. LHD-90]
MAITDQTAPPAKGPSMIVQLAVLLVMTAAAVGGGWFAGGYLGMEGAEAATGGKAAAADHGTAAKGGYGAAAGGEASHSDQAAGNPLLVPLAPMTTNLAAPSKIWVRMELALVLDAPQPAELVEAVHQDLFAYMRTLKLHQIEGPSGYQHLKADLEDRARVRSDGHVRQVLIRTLLFE